ncbi:T9SS type A sorting domain-containing protein [Neolewinella sp.]|uniref:T9SS type A sorting domain-containing protein n=1 Tax=Neolewinella sp. TaxID=2993543 RepID=UPI003B52DA29
MEIKVLSGIFAVMICLSSGLPGQSIGEAEYFFNTDPGVGNGLSLAVQRDGTAGAVEADVSVAGLNPGFHTLSIRYRDSEGVWGLTETRQFFVEEATAQKKKIVGAEYYFDNAHPDPGTAIPLPVDPTGQIDTTYAIELSGLAVGDHTVHFRLLDSGGGWSYTEARRFTLAVPRLDSITPNYGGNTGMATVNVLGAGFDENTEIKLTHDEHPTIEVPDTAVTSVYGSLLVLTLDLEGKAEGVYDVEVTLVDGTELSLPKAFSVEAGQDADPYVKIIGPNAIRRRQWYTYSVMYGNRGNTDATGVPMFLQLPSSTSPGKYELNYDMSWPSGGSNNDSGGTPSPPGSAPPEFGKLPPDYPFSYPQGTPGESRVVLGILPILGPGEVGTLTFNLYASVDNSNGNGVGECLPLSAWVSPAMFQKGLLNPDVFDCFAEVAALSFGSIPGFGCGYGAADLALRPVLRRRLTGQSGFEVSSFVQGAGFAILGCVPGGRVGGKLAQVAEAVAHAGTQQGVYKTFASCGRAFMPTSPKTDKCVELLVPFDPNDKIGLDGAGLRKYVYGDEPLPYLIRFENIESANAAAQVVRLVDTLDTAAFDVSTLELQHFTIGSRQINIPPGHKNYSTDVDLRPGTDLIVRFTAEMYESTGVMTWLFESLDPGTLQPTPDPVAGFLPPNVKSPQGEGSVFFTVQPRSDLTTDRTISNKAAIYFDANEPITTPTWTNTVDKSAPVSSVNALPATQEHQDFEVSWSGNDEGSGIRAYNIYMALNDGPYGIWLRNVEYTAAPFEGQVDSTYRFYSIAIDSSDIFEDAPPLADATTTVTTTTSTQLPVADEISIYPIPASNLLKVEVPDQLLNSQLNLLDGQGRTVYTVVADQRESILRVRDLPQGLYILKISTRNSTVSKKILIIR